MGTRRQGSSTYRWDVLSDVMWADAKISFDVASSVDAKRWVDAMIFLMPQDLSMLQYMLMPLSLSLLKSPSMMQGPSIPWGQFPRMTNFPLLLLLFPRREALEPEPEPVLQLHRRYKMWDHDWGKVCPSAFCWKQNLYE